MLTVTLAVLNLPETLSSDEKFGADLSDYPDSHQGLFLRIRMTLT